MNRVFDHYGLMICRFQAQLFEASLNETSCSTPVFIRRFMHSQAARRMDGEGFMFEATGREAVFEEIEEEYGPSTYGKVRYSAAELYWIGYIYRYWCYTDCTSSRHVYKIIKPGELRDLYFAYHSLDPAAAIERIKEAKGIREEDYTARGVEIFRQIYAREKEAIYDESKS